MCWGGRREEGTTRHADAGDGVGRWEGMDCFLPSSYYITI